MESDSDGSVVVAEGAVAVASGTAGIVVAAAVGAEAAGWAWSGSRCW